MISPDTRTYRIALFLKNLNDDIIHLSRHRTDGQPDISVLVILIYFRTQIPWEAAQFVHTTLLAHTCTLLDHQSHGRFV